MRAGVLSRSRSSPAGAAGRRRSTRAPRVSRAYSCLRRPYAVGGYQAEAYEHADLDVHAMDEQAIEQIVDAKDDQSANRSRQDDPPEVALTPRRVGNQRSTQGPNNQHQQ